MADAAGAGRRATLDVEVGGVIDVPLVGTGGDRPEPSGSGESAPEPNWRRAVAIGLVGGTLLATGVIVALAVADDATDRTAPDGSDAAAITTPATLAPLTALPPPDIGAVGVPTTLPTVVRPTYDAVLDVNGVDPSAYDLGSAITRLDEDVPRRSATHVELGNGGFVIDVTIERDPVRDRYQIVLESAGDTQVAIVDVPSGITYVNPGTDNRVEVANEEIISGSNVTDVNEYFDRLLVGPVRSDTYDPQSTSAGEFVTIYGIGQAQEYVTTIVGDLAPEWQLYAFSPVFEFPVTDRPTSLEYAVYVNDDGRIAQVDGIAYVGDVAQLVRHRVTLLDEPPLVDVPDPAQPSATAPVIAP